MSTISPLTSGSKIGPPDLGDIPTFPIEPELYPKSSGGKIISTEGCFSCKVRLKETITHVYEVFLLSIIYLINHYYRMQINGDGRLRHRRTANISSEIISLNYDENGGGPQTVNREPYITLF